MYVRDARKVEWCEHQEPGMDGSCSRQAVVAIDAGSYGARLCVRHALALISDISRVMGGLLDEK